MSLFDCLSSTAECNTDFKTNNSINTMNRGIKNVDSICYASTSLHLLMLIPNIMKHIETIIQKEDNDNDNGYSNDNKYIAVLWQFQQFVHQYHDQLKDSEKNNSADIVILCETLAEVEGQDFDEEISRDVVAFTQELLNAINKSSLKNVLNLTELVGGEFINEYKTECGKSRQTFESFYFLRFAPSKAIRDLHQALSEFTKGSSMKSQWKTIKQDENGNDIVHKESIDTNYCTRIKRLADHFFVHLKRFTIDYKTMTNEKVKSYFSFPLELDMSPYFDIDDSSCSIYDLSGIIIHEGDSDDGHYYVIVKNCIADESDKQWLLIDDKHVEYFNINNLPNVAFGEIENDDDNVNVDEVEDQSAYLLLYQKRK